MSKMFDVFNYWKDKCITEDGDVMIEYGYEGYDKEALSKVDSIPVVYDWGEPECFACRAYLYDYEPYPKNYDECLADESNNGLRKIWDNQHTFERAHIYPKAMGGKSSADNIFCLCPRCHKESPDTRFPKEFFKWVYNRRTRGSFYHMAAKELENRGGNPLFLNQHDLNLDNFNSHGGYVADSTIVATLVGCAEERENFFNEACKMPIDVAEVMIDKIKKPIDRNNNLHIA